MTVRLLMPYSFVIIVVIIIHLYFSLYMIRFKMVNMHADFVFVLFSNGTDVSHRLSVFTITDFLLVLSLSLLLSLFLFLLPHSLIHSYIIVILM